jgi:CheY-like chemotaxis protein
MTLILVVEDNELNRDMLRRRLERRGFDVVVAGDGAAAVAAVREQRPDLVLMDMSLPEVDGWEATRRLKADEATRSVPVVALTAHAMPDDRERALAAGCDDYATKPVDFDALIDKVRALAGDAEQA